MGIENIGEAIYDDEIGYAYNPITGQLWSIRELNTWHEREDGRKYASSTSVQGLAKRTTHIMWFIMTGSWPTKPYIDHKDGNPENMTWDNLREASGEQNGVNRHSDSFARIINDVYMYPGVRRSGKNSFSVQYKNKHFGTFPTVEEANAFAFAKRKEIYGEFLREDDTP